MKIQLLTEYYPPFLARFCKEHPELENLSFSAAQQLLLEQFHADTGAAYAHLLKHGYEAEIIIVNCDFLQKKWAVEHHIGFSENNWQKELAFARVKHFQPDIFYLESVFAYFGEFVQAARAYCRSVVCWISTPFSQELPLSGIDLIFSSTPAFVEGFRKKGVDSEYMLPSFDTRILEQIPKIVAKDISFSFVGGLGTAHINRRTALEQLVQNSDLKIWGYGYKPDFPIFSKAFLKNLLKPVNARLLRAYSGEAWGLEMYRILQRSLITFNIHEALLKGNVGNMRMFEASGVGTMLLNDEGLNLSELFVPGKEIETYSSLEEALEKVKYYESHPEKAMEIGKAAQKRTLSDYTYDHFVEQLDLHVKTLLP